MAVLSEDETGRRCVAAVLALSCAHVLTVIGTDYQVYVPIDKLQIDYAFFVNHAIFLGPVALLLLVRRNCVLVGILAIPTLIIFGLRMHHVWQFYWFGINSMARQKGDELGWFDLIFDTLSASIAAFCLLVILPSKLIGSVQQFWRR